MATLTAQNPTLLDRAQASDPDGSVGAVVELLHQTNEILQDMTFMEGNLPTGHRSIVRTGLPPSTWRRLGGGVMPGKAQRAQMTDTCGMLEAYNEVDVALADLNGDTAAFRAQEAVAQIESMGQELAETLIYGNIAVAPEKFEGLATRYSDLSGPANADNIIDGEGSGTDNGSIWLVVWGPNTCHGIVPKGSQTGLQVTDKGRMTIQNADGSRMEAYITHFRMDVGLTLRDWRYVVRICNIDKSALTSDAASGANLPELMFQALERVPSLSMGRPVFYMSRDMRTKFRQQYALLTKNSTLTKSDVGGDATVMDLNGVPIRRCDALAADEARVV